MGPWYGAGATRRFGRIVAMYVRPERWLPAQSPGYRTTPPDDPHETPAHTRPPAHTPPDLRPHPAEYSPHGYKASPALEPPDHPDKI